MARRLGFKLVLAAKPGCNLGMWVPTSASGHQAVHIFLKHCELHAARRH